MVLLQIGNLICTTDGNFRLACSPRPECSLAPVNAFEGGRHTTFVAGPRWGSFACERLVFYGGRLGRDICAALKIQKSMAEATQYRIKKDLDTSKRLNDEDFPALSDSLVSCLSPHFPVPSSQWPSARWDT